MITNEVKPEQEGGDEGQSIFVCRPEHHRCQTIKKVKFCEEEK